MSKDKWQEKIQNIEEGFIPYLPKEEGYEKRYWRLLITVSMPVVNDLDQCFFVRHIPCLEERMKSSSSVYDGDRNDSHVFACA